MSEITQYENTDLKVLKKLIDFCDNIKYEMNQMDLVPASLSHINQSG